MVAINFIFPYNFSEGWKPTTNQSWVRLLINQVTYGVLWIEFPSGSLLDVRDQLKQVMKDALQQDKSEVFVRLRMTNGSQASALATPPKGRLEIQP